jgi:hypothetical protein
MNNFKILDSIWFTAIGDHIGIIIGETEDGNRKAYINAIRGDNFDEDIKKIAKWGAPFPLDAAYELFKHLKPNE